ncbi:hypothetical protein T11_5992 [Trichinella zimbabwensis]|uniref:Uncharacterized protein n=1 Tax=Trichinella zimbabwensis TaxID=268475 RepID=A0A0V1HE69_9BILA|nr:hypothetical protein T11_5992 [Trichinella zimbabwensis]
MERHSTLRYSTYNTCDAQLKVFSKFKTTVNYPLQMKMHSRRFLPLSCFVMSLNFSSNIADISFYINSVCFYSTKAPQPYVEDHANMKNNL